MKKLLALMLALAMSASLMACGGSSSSAAPAADDTTAAAGESAGAEDGTQAAGGEASFTINEDDPEVTIMVAHGSAEETVLHRACLEYKRLIEEYSQGKITVEVYPNGTLMNVAEMNEAIKDGTIQVIVGSPSSMMDTSLGIFELPNLINSVEQAHEVMQPGTDFRTILDDLFQKNGIRLAAIEPCDFRMLTSNVEVRSYDDLSGLRVRLMNSEIPMSYWAQWGANPTPMDWSDVYMSLKNNMIDAQENPYDSIIGSNLQEVQKYLIASHHVMFYTGFMMNEAFYQSLPDNYKALLDQVAVEIAEYSYQDALASSESNRKFLEDAGMTFIELTDEDYTKMRENASEADALVRDAMGEDLFNRMMAALGF